MLTLNEIKKKKCRRRPETFKYENKQRRDETETVK